MYIIFILPDYKIDIYFYAGKAQKFADIYLRSNTDHLSDYQ